MLVASGRVVKRLQLGLHLASTCEGGFHAPDERKYVAGACT